MSVSDRLVAAADDGDVRAVATLLAAGADPDSANREGTTPLYAAVHSGVPGVVDQLLGAGADVNRPSHHGPPLSLVAYVPDALVARLLAHGANPEAVDTAGTTTLYAAAVAGEAGKVRQLLEAGADPNRISTGPGEGTPLCAAACWGYLETVDALLSHGADPNLPRG